MLMAKEGDIYQHRSHNKNLLMVHLILVSKYRKKLFLGRFKNDVKQYIFDVCVSHKWYVKRMETDKDHIHILLQYKPTDSITKIVSTLKQQSTYLAWKYHSDMLRSNYWKEQTLWSGGCFAASIGQASQKIIKQYIKQQG